LPLDPLGALRPTNACLEAFARYGAFEQPWKSLASANAAVKAMHTSIIAEIVVHMREGRIYYSSGTSLLLAGHKG